METNEQIKQTLKQEMETVLDRLLDEVQTVKEGDLERLEQVVLQMCLAVGRGWLKEFLAQHHSGPARRQGTCGHHQQLVATRPKRLLTLLGEVEVRRPYYQCLREKDVENPVAACPHGEAPWDKLWGVEKRRTSPGGAKTGELFGSDDDVRGDGCGL